MKLILSRRRASNEELNRIIPETNDSMENIDAAYNKLDENLELDFNLPKSMTKLRLAHNRLQAFPKFILDLNVGISVLDLSYNHIKELNEVNFWENASMMTKLCLQGNQLERLPDCLEMFKGLKILILGDDLSGNCLTELPKTLESLANLEELSVARNKLQSFPVQILSLPRLKKLNLARNRITNFPDDSIAISNVDLSYNMISELPKKLDASSTFKRIDLTGNPLKYIPAGLPIDKFILSCNACFFLKQTTIEVVEEFKRPQLKYLALDQASKQGKSVSCPLTLQSCFEKSPSACASCPFRFMHPYGEVMLPGVVQGHHQVPVLSEVCSQACAMGQTVKLSLDNTLCINDDDLNDF